MATQKHVLKSEGDVYSLANSQTTDYPVNLAREGACDKPEKCEDDYDLISKASLMLLDDPSTPLMVWNAC